MVEIGIEVQVVRLGSFQNLYLSFAIVEITHGVTANRDDILMLSKLEGMKQINVTFQQE